MRKNLYTSNELMVGFDPGDPLSYIKTWDFRQYARFVAAGGSNPSSVDERIYQATHDASISAALGGYLSTIRPSPPRLVAVMGGHSLARNSPSYKLIGSIARDLTTAGFLLVTGGGPGAMEAAHLGAYFSSSSAKAFEDALAILGSQPALVDCSDLVDSQGKIKPGKEQAVMDAHAWVWAALSAKKVAAPGASPGHSIGIPTWVYGQEPTTVFATVYAKYFQNSIREETLVAQGRSGVMYARGGGGTLREVFQDVEQNYYVRNQAEFIPMIFVDDEEFWTTDAVFDDRGKILRAGLKVDDLLNRTFRFALAPDVWKECMKRVLYTKDVGTIKQALESHSTSAQENLAMMLRGVDASVFMARSLK